MPGGGDGHGNCRPARVRPSDPVQPARTTPTENDETARSGIAVLGTLALVILVIGGLNWGLVGIAGIDLIEVLFGRMTVASRAIYALVGAAALYCIVKLPRWSRAG